MKYLCVGDKHLRFLPPTRRIDNFSQVQFEKEKQILEIAQNENAVILQPGDFWDSYNPSRELITRYIRLYKQYPNTLMYSILGSHDMYMYSLDSLDKTASMILQEAVGLRLLSSAFPIETSDAFLYGCNVGEEMPSIVRRRGKDEGRLKRHILLIHAMIADRDAYPGVKRIEPKDFIEAHSFDLVVCGDYHFPFEYAYNNRIIVDCGITTRKSIIEKDIIPSVYLWDSETFRGHFIPLKHTSGDEVFSRKDTLFQRGADKAENNDIGVLTQFLEAGLARDKTKIDFRKNLRDGLKSPDISDKVKSIVMNLLAKEN